MLKADIVFSDRSGLRVIQYGSIYSKPAIIIFERAPFSACLSHLHETVRCLTKVKNLGANDIYYWYIANTSFSPPLHSSNEEISETASDLKINLIFPCTEQHIQKYSKQILRTVVESPQVYHDKVLPYIIRKREAGSLTWVWNIFEGKTEVNDVIYRTPSGQNQDEGFLLLPDLNWDRSTQENLHILGLVERKDIWSLRDLKKKHVHWLRGMRDSIVRATLDTYEWLDADQLKLYVHYQPTYYHFHIHIVHVAMEGGTTQAVGKAVGLDAIIESLMHMDGDQEQGIEKMTLQYTLGEASEIWTEIFEPLKKQGINDKLLPCE